MRLKITTEENEIHNIKVENERWAIEVAREWEKTKGYATFELFRTGERKAFAYWGNLKKSERASIR